MIERRNPNNTIPDIILFCILFMFKIDKTTFESNITILAAKKVVPFLFV
ncbi:hypothetical protein [Clostridioides difficile]|nr:hypothetical protein [Clostridioides difficile]MCJ0310333.1 hypothetical protein [Clostridioides difficile]MCJ0377607.1 hypothetical protein [Clostridioides difficile]MCJ0410826.1 hypothetical protein [Clostridioides difficile]MCO8703374.1 hypothetical protein [Clostridioides difficile]MDX5712208.1 hypothetical protein [Clostridioides difficile]